MTREEAKTHLTAMKAKFEMLLSMRGLEISDVFDVAIEALSAEPCGDAVSRQAVIDTTFCNGISCNECSFITLDDGKPVCSLYERVMKLPPVTPKVSECEDCISRAELLKAIDTWDKFGVDDTNSLFRLDNLSLPHYVPYIHFDDVVKCIKGMPSVTPKQKMRQWIPVSERLPEPYGQVLRTVKSIGWNGTFSIYVDIGTVCPIDTDVIAWMPIPVPYKAESEE